MPNPLKKINRHRGNKQLGSKPTQLTAYPTEYKCPKCNSIYLAIINGKTKCLSCGWS